MKLSFVATALLAAHASAIPVAGDAAAASDSQATHGGLSAVPGADIATGLATELGVPVEALLKELLGLLGGVVPVKRDQESDDQVTHGGLSAVPGADIVTKLAAQLGVPVEALLKELLGLLGGVVPVKRSEDGAIENNLVDVDAVQDSVNGLNIPLDQLLDKLLALLGGLAKRDAEATDDLLVPLESLLKEVLGAADGLVKSSTKELSKDLSGALELLKGILSQLLASENKKLNQNTLIKLEVLKNSLNNLLA